MRHGVVLSVVGDAGAGAAGAAVKCSSTSASALTPFGSNLMAGSMARMRLASRRASSQALARTHATKTVP